MKNTEWPTLGTLRNVSIGFDDIFNQVEAWNKGRVETSGFPPYNIVKHSDTKYTIEMAVAGMSKNNISATVSDGVLNVTYTPNRGSTDDKKTFIYRGISSRSWSKSFHVADHVEVVSSYMENGILVFELELKLPEEKKPRSITISGG